MNQIVFREGDVAEIFYVIKSGIVLCSKEAYIGTRVKDFGYALVSTFVKNCNQKQFV